MTLPLSILGLFCEDIRQERAGTETLVGVLSDNVRVPAVPGMMGKLGIYVRVNFDPAQPPSAGSLFMRFPDNSTLPIGDISDELINKARVSTLEDGGQLAGIKLMVTLGGLGIPTSGRMQLIVKLGAEEHLCGALNIKVAPEPPVEAISASDSPPPSLQ